MYNTTKFGKEYHRHWRDTHREQVKRAQRKYYHSEKFEQQKERKYARTKAYNERTKRKVLTHYGGGKCACLRCGFEDLRALSIDHIDGTGYKHRGVIGRSGGVGFYNWLIKNNYPIGYQTLCMNCQWIKKRENNENANRKCLE